MVFEDAGGGGVVDGALSGEVRTCGHEKGGVGETRLGFEKDVGSLAWSEENDVGLKWFDVDGVGFDDGEGMIGNAEEELVVECSVD